MADPIKRVHYFDHQFLHVEDFEDEQDYHLGSRRRHSRLLHTWGIAQGLEVRFDPGAAGGPAVVLAPGMAVDLQGREIVLVDEHVEPLSNFPQDAARFVVVSYDEVQSDTRDETGVSGATRWTETPRVEVLDAAPAGADEGMRIVAASVTRRTNSGGDIDNSVRRLAGVAGGDLEVHSLTLSDRSLASTDWVRVDLPSARHIRLTGALHVSDRLGVGTDVPQQTLSVNGALNIDQANLNNGALNPGLTFGSTSNEGLSSDRLPGGNQFGLDFYTNNQRRLSITRTGNVGIGTQTPQQMLSIQGGLNIDQAGANNGTVNPGLTFGSNSGEGISSDRQPGDNQFGLDFYTGSTRRLSITGAGNVGVGTVAPSERLTIEGGSVLVSGEGAGLIVDAEGEKRVGFIKYPTREAGIWRLNNQDFEIGRVESAITALPGAPASPTVDLYVSGDGRIGIGTAQPQRTLHIEGTEVHSGGPSGGFSFASRNAAGFIDNPPNGERWVWYADQGRARLWSNGDKLILNPQGGVDITSGDLGMRSTSNRFIGFTTTKLDNENDFQPSNIKFSMGFLGLQLPGTPPFNSEFIIGHSFASPIVNIPSSFVRHMSVTHNGDLIVRNNASVQTLTIRSGQKPGYVVDHFVNNTGDDLEQGDVVAIAESSTRFWATGNSVPMPEVDLTDQAYDTRVCGVVAGAVARSQLPYVEPAEAAAVEGTAEEPAGGRPKGRRKQQGDQAREVGASEEAPDPAILRALRIQAAEASNPLRELAVESADDADATRVHKGQLGSMVTLGAFAFCKIDADIAPIKAGDLLTTSPTKGHAQRAEDGKPAHGAIVGKALASLDSGKGKIPVLVMLQ